MRKQIYKKGNSIFQDRYTYFGFIFQNFFDPLATDWDSSYGTFESYKVIDNRIFENEDCGNIQVGYGETPQGNKYFIAEINPKDKEIENRIYKILDGDYTKGQFDDMYDLIDWYTRWLR